MREKFLANGFTEADGNAEICVINGCSVTSTADRKCRQLIKTLKKRTPGVNIVATGCYVENEEHKKSGIDLIVKQKEKAFIADKVISCFYDSGANKGFDGSCADLEISNFLKHRRVFIKVQDGCDNFCSYCIIPYLRGRPVSRAVESIVREIQALEAKGFREAVLTGIDMGSWGRDLGDGRSLRDLLVAIEGSCRIEKIRLRDDSWSLIQKKYESSI